MKNSELIEKTYSEAVQGLKEDWFSNSNTFWYDYVVNLPVHLKVTYLIVISHNQIFNGGFHQYFVNGYGQFAIETINALLDIGAFKRSKFLEAAYKIINSNNLSVEIFRKELLNKEIRPLFETDELYTQLDGLDNKYYNIDDEVIEELLGNYLASR